MPTVIKQLENDIWNLENALAFKRERLAEALAWAAQNADIQHQSEPPVTHPPLEIVQSSKEIA